ELEAEAKESAGCECEKPVSSDVVEPGSNEPESAKPKKRGKPSMKPVGVPDDKAQKNFTDPESKIMLAGDKSFIQGYNAQAAADSDYQVVVATMVTNQAADSQHVESMTEQIEENNGRLSDEMSLDAGYYSNANVEYLKSKHIDMYMPPCRLKHREYRDAKPESLTEASTLREQMKSKVLTDDGRG
ncbi:MAG: transposase, partial [Armatimonadetes bacterium]|nr:transposase [Armatimonadota bacterium]